MNEELYPDSMAVEQWEYKGAVCYLVQGASMQYYCGYVRFSEKPVKEDGYDGILTYVPVHGGITYARNDGYGMVYGFDCAHLNDENDPKTRDIAWLKSQCNQMTDGIGVAAEFEDSYLTADDNEQRAKVIDAYHDKITETTGATFEIQDNFSAMLRLMCGKL